MLNKVLKPTILYKKLLFFIKNKYVLVFNFKNFIKNHLDNLRHLLDNKNKSCKDYFILDFLFLKSNHYINDKKN